LAVRLGVSTASLSQTIRVATIGDVAPELARFDSNGRIVPIRVLLDEQARADRQVLEQLRVPSPRGALVPLAALADFSFGAGPTGINRHDRRRQANVQADLVPGKALSQASAAVHALPMMKKENLPPGVTVLEGGDAELQEELFDGFGQAMRDGLTMVYLVLALLFGSLLQPLTILFSLPLSVAGAMMALILANLAITDEEKKMFIGQLNSILEYVEQLNSLNTENVEPTAQVVHTHEQNFSLRQDEPHVTFSQEESLGNGPAIGAANDVS
jgi:aspartyl/glutamyl-tRNA(Asn/Gln) amidotransferase C subunit